MAKKKNSRASWFKVFLHQKTVIDSVPDATAGKALKAALCYFETGKEPEGIDPLVLTVYSCFKQYIDEAFSDYQAISEKNRKNVQKRYVNQDIRTVTSGNHSLPSDTEKEAEDNSASFVDISAAPGLNAGEQGKPYFDSMAGEWRYPR